jgi:hypothetical protein
MSLLPPLHSLFLVHKRILLCSHFTATFHGVVTCCLLS